MVHVFKKYWTSFINLFTNSKSKKHDNKKHSINNLEKDEIPIVSVKVRYIKEKMKTD